MNLKLYKLSANCTTRSLTYFVVAETTTKAEEAVLQHHKKHNYIDIDSLDSVTLAQTWLGKPAKLIIAHMDGLL